MRVKGVKVEADSFCLNPCFNGRYSLSKALGIAVGENVVLILVLMEDTH